ncbi:hypothetical protein Droror1_Dr00009317 [Drosera rotundifolia]
MAAAAAPNFAPPAAFITPAILANAAIPPTSMALSATVGFTSIFSTLLGLPKVIFLEDVTQHIQKNLKFIVTNKVDNQNPEIKEKILSKIYHSESLFTSIVSRPRSYVHDLSMDILQSAKQRAPGK